MHFTNTNNPVDFPKHTDPIRKAFEEVTYLSLRATGHGLCRNVKGEYVSDALEDHWQTFQEGWEEAIKYLQERKNSEYSEFERVYECGYNERVRELNVCRQQDLPIYIVAGTYEQFRTYCKEKEPDVRRFRYVSGPETLRGISNPEVEYIGTWRDRTDIQEIIMQVKVSLSKKW